MLSNSLSSANQSNSTVQVTVQNNVNKEETAIPYRTVFDYLRTKIFLKVILKQFSIIKKRVCYAYVLEASYNVIIYYVIIC